MVVHNQAFLAGSSPPSDRTTAEVEREYLNNEYRLKMILSAFTQPFPCLIQSSHLVSATWLFIIALSGLKKKKPLKSSFTLFFFFLSFWLWIKKKCHRCWLRVFFSNVLSVTMPLAVNVPSSCQKWQCNYNNSVMCSSELCRWWEVMVRSVCLCHGSGSHTLLEGSEKKSSGVCYFRFQKT